MIAILFIIFVLIIIAAAIYHNLPKPPHEVIPALRNQDVKMIFNSEKDERIFTCTHHKIKAKPDFVYEYPDGTLAIVEYKSRKKGVMPSDIAQLIASTIAVKGHHTDRKIKLGYVLTGSGNYKEINLDKTSDQLIQEIEKPLLAVRNILKGMSATPCSDVKKCRGCGFRHICSFSKA